MALSGNASEAVGVFIFAGGFSLGIRAAGFKVLAHLEGGDYGVATARNLLPGLRVWQDQSIWPLRMLRDRGVPFVYCNPPCAIWSVAGSSMTRGKASWRTDPRTSCIHDVMRVLEGVRPRVLCWESVTQAWTRGRGLLVELQRKAAALGYATTYLFTSAELHGVPQPRFRLVTFYHKVTLDLPRPVTTYRNVGDVLQISRDADSGEWSQRCPVWGEPTTHRGYFYMMGMLRPREGMRDMVEELRGSGELELDSNPAFMAHRLSIDGRGKTLTSAVMEVHPVFPRWIANSEVAALGGWPHQPADADLYVGDTSLVRAQLTQCVLPPVGEYVGRQVMQALEKNETAEVATSAVSHIAEDRPGLGRL